MIPLARLPLISPACAWHRWHGDRHGCACPSIAGDRCEPALAPNPDLSRCPSFKKVFRKGEQLGVLYPQLPDSKTICPCIHQSPTDAAATKGHIDKLRSIAQKSHPVPPLEGDGILLCGGGKYWPMLYVAIRMIREVSDLPIQVWHRGLAEPINYVEVRGIPDVTFRDADRLEPAPKKLGGWEIKTVALKNCGWRRVLYIDADAYPVANPRPLLDMLNGNRFVFWSDLPHMANNIKWEWYGMKAAGVPPIQGGQLAINVETFWRELCIADWINQHSEYFYAHQYGDQDSWRVALAITAGTYRHLGAAPWCSPAFICRIDNKPLIVHRCGGKTWNLKNARREPHLPMEDKVWRFLEEQSLGGTDAAEVFSRIYRDGRWGHGDASGGGSTAVEAAPYLEIVNGLIRSERWSTVVDLACGDGAITSKLIADRVIGVDCYEPHLARLRQAEPLREWQTLDLDRDRERLPAGDVAFLKDVLHHWPERLVQEWVAWARASGKWRVLLLTSDLVQNQPDCVLGGYRGLDPDMEPMMSLGGQVVKRYLHKAIVRIKC